MRYFDEFRTYWRRLAASCLGIAFGYSFNNYLNNVFIPELMGEFGWDSATIASLGTVAIFAVVFQPLAGRITDVIGIRWIAIFGISAGAMLFLALSFMQGSFGQFYLLNVGLIILFASTTGPVVYSRLIAESFDKARGVALALATSSYAITGAIAVPLVSAFIEQEGWRAGYRLIAAVIAIAGFVTIALIPRTRGPRALAAEAEPGRTASLKEVIHNPAFRLIITGVVLCSVTLMMQTTQLKVVLQNLGLSSMNASYAISIYAIGAIAGRFFCGAALDRFPTHIVAAIAMGLPGIGLLILSMNDSSFVVLAVAVLFLGMSLGAEGDLAGYLAMTYFKIEVYSTVIGAFLGSVGLSAALGAVILTVVLNTTGSFAPFLLMSAASAFAGSAFFWRLKSVPNVVPAHGAAA